MPVCVAAIAQRCGAALVRGKGSCLVKSSGRLLLTNEDYAMLIGSIGLLAILGAIMFVTRWVDWYAVGTRSESAVAE